MSNSLENYLAQFRAQLKALPAAERDAEVEEARQHLQALIQQRIEKGESEEAAIAAAVKQFGDATDHAKALCRAWKRENDNEVERFLSITHRLFAVVTVYSVLLNVCLWVCLYGTHNYWTIETISRFPNLLSWSLFLKSDTYSVAMVMANIFFAVFALISLRFPQEMKITFLGVFVGLIATNIMMSIVWDLTLGAWDSSARNLIAPRYFIPWHILYVSYTLKAVVFFWSGFATSLGLVRYKSLLSPPRKQRLS